MFKDQHTDLNLTITEGLYDPKGPRKPTRKRKTAYVNDGRAPDTVKLLAEAEAAIPKPSTQQPASHTLPATQLMSYKWISPNSCFWDHTLEILFRAWMVWSQKEKDHFRSILPSDTFLSFLAHHFVRRAERMMKSDVLRVTQELTLGQLGTKRRIEGELDILEKSGQYFCAGSWFAKAVTVRCLVH